MEKTKLKRGDKMEFTLEGETLKCELLTKMCVGDADLVVFSVIGQPGRKFYIYLQQLPNGNLIQKPGAKIFGH